MILGTEAPKFSPVTITLETPEEAAVIKDILGRAGGPVPGDIAYKIWEHIERQLQGSGYVKTFRVDGDGVDFVKI